MLDDFGQFVGRLKELNCLKPYLEKQTASLIVVRGRRRIGKSRLIKEFAKNSTFYSFAGLAPTKQTTAQMQRDHFALQLSQQTELPEVKADDWTKLFQLLFEKIKQGRVVLLFDEISWMGSEDSEFLSKIKHAWDELFKKNPQLVFVICGSASAWIEKNILASTGFLGRVSYTLTLEELPLKDCAEFWHDKYQNISVYEKFKLLSVVGGVPRYLEEINPAISSEENIARLCFTKGGILVDEFGHIFSNMFQRRTPLYQAIVRSLVNAPKETGAISEACQVEITGLLTEYLDELSLCGFIRRDYTWNIENGQDSRLSQYRLSDNYMRFYLRYIEKYKTKIDRGSYEFVSFASLSEWRIILGLQFENLVLNNRNFIQDFLNINAVDVVNDNPFFQRKTTRQQGCQIDYMIQTKFNTLYVCEIKFSKNPIGSDVVSEIQQKINRIKKPKGFSCRPVLIHVNGVTEDLVQTGYFSSIIDFSEILN
ncbi:MAG: ATP-binding protein [Coxiellaceae bacterium]|nr:ATP-binding protein [Coxiellaceae bacterium]